MKFMMNGALTIGTPDGANVEMHELLGDENMFLFGMTAQDVEECKREGYNPDVLFHHNPDIKGVLDSFSLGFDDGIAYSDLTAPLLFGGGAADEYMLLADFERYKTAYARLAGEYPNRNEWNKKALINIARSGVFAADRSVHEYAKKIWRV